MAVITLGAFSFRPRLLTTVAAVAGIVLTFFLGEWQIGRADFKQGLQDRQDALARESVVSIGVAPLAADDIQLRKVEVRGEFEPKFTVFVDNRLYQHQPGYHVATPLRIAGSQRYVLVNRGWVPASRDRSLPVVQTPAGEQVVNGTAVTYSEKFMELSTKVAEGNVWQNLVFERYRQATGLDLQPFVIQQDSTVDDGMKREWKRPDLGRNTHLAYAFQWHALSFAIFIYYLVTHVKRSPTAQP
jgi:surfeit locus 1 family protein